jgi:glycosyltransferase involved in cell wall biosynthesis
MTDGSRPGESDRPAPMLSGRPLCIAQMIESDEPGGAELVLVELAVELRRRGHRVITIGPSKGVGWLGERLRERGFEMDTFSIRRPVDWRCLRDLTRLLRSRGVDLVHSHEFTMCVYGAASARLLRVPHVTTMHGNQKMTKALRRRIALRWAFRNSAATVAVSDATRRSLTADLGLRPKSIGVVLNGVPVRPGQPDAVRAEFGIGESELLLLALGTVVPRKGHMILLRALHRLEQAGRQAPPWRLIIAGWLTGEEPDRLRQFIAEAGMADRVHLAGQRQDVPDLLAAADVFVMPSLWEGLPLAILEAMLAQKAIVASVTSGIPEAINDGQEGLLVPPGDEAALAEALGRVLSDAALRSRLAAQARARALREFTVECMTDQYERLYASGLK